MSKKAADQKASSLFSPEVAELVAIGAAIASNCETCFKYHYSQARKLGVSREDMIQAVELAHKVKCAPAQNMLALADRILDTDFTNKEFKNATPECCNDEARAKITKGKCCS
jgi:AhpD family alkylhydroperoxidase